MSDNRKYPCPKCSTGELYDTGSMFIQEVECDNPKCNYRWCDSCGVISGDIID